MKPSLYNNPQLVIESGQTPEGMITWQSPSNLALIKYWGKYGQQMPRNPSISLTLEQAYTHMTLEWGPKDGTDKSIELELFFQQMRHEGFEEELKLRMQKLLEMFPFLHQMRLIVDTYNSFPHSAGIASSASSMSALALCLCSLEDELFGTLSDDKEFERKASYAARLLSGSACRSIYGTAAIWGETPGVADSSDLYAIPMESKIHNVFKSFHNAILIVSQQEKSVSSSAGHQLMQDHPFADARYQQAKQRLHQILGALESGEVDRVGDIIEQEALTLHALMMQSNPSYILMEPATISLIKKIRQYRKDTGIPAYFSLDAGPNIHLLYPDDKYEQVTDFIVTELVPHCQDGVYISDKVGEGPVQI
jgi:diphosphomevalonate decarboxylase